MNYPFKEEFLHYVWQHKLFDLSALKTTDNQSIKIVNSGQLQPNSGPDFFNGQIELDGIKWAGNIELHIKSSNWLQHNHQNDEAYDNVILHVVYEADVELQRKNGEHIPTLELKNFIDDKLVAKYLMLMQSANWIPCHDHINKIDEFTVKLLQDALVVERLSSKTLDIEIALKQNNNNWEETFYQFIAMGFGLKVNAEPFQLLARNSPLNSLIKHKNNLSQIEAILYGNAGLLNDKLTDKYGKSLFIEHQFLKKKYGFTDQIAHSWKFSKIRPSAFPTIRIALLAQLIYQSNHLLSKLLETTNVKDIYNLFKLKASPYWDNHYQFDKEAKNKKEKVLGKTAIQLIIINVVCPFLFVYGKQMGKNDVIEKSLELLHSLPAENNNIIKNWKDLGLDAKTAYESQAMIQLKNNYCNKKQCLRCQIGHKIVTSK